MVLVVLTVIDRMMIITWDGGRDVRVAYDAELQVLGPVVERYDNRGYRHLEEMAALAQSHGDSVQDYLFCPYEPERTNGEIVLMARGSGKKSALITYYENWYDGFVAEITTADGARYLAWAQADMSAEELVVTFKLEDAELVDSKRETK